MCALFMHIHLVFGFLRLFRGTYHRRRVPSGLLSAFGSIFPPTRRLGTSPNPLNAAVRLSHRLERFPPRHNSEADLLLKLHPIIIIIGYSDLRSSSIANEANSTSVPTPQKRPQSLIGASERSPAGASRWYLTS